MNRIAKEYGIKRNYDIKITSKMGTAGMCVKDDKIIKINTSAIDLDTLYHEIAHWLQQEKWGIESFCQTMDRRKGFDMKTANHHAQLMKEIENFSKKWGYEEKIRWIMIQ